jgi:hypothetical protein
MILDEKRACCLTCAYGGNSEEGDNICVKNPPVPAKKVEDLGRFPLVDKDCWCGSYRNCEEPDLEDRERIAMALEAICLVLSTHFGVNLPAGRYDKDQCFIPSRYENVLREMLYPDSAAVADLPEVEEMVPELSEVVG